MHRLTRLAYNTAGWSRPTGEAAKLEFGNAQSRKYGFAHEEWLFRSEWMIDGWRYAFLQGVNADNPSTVEPLDVTLFTIDEKKRRCLVATIKDLECLDEQQAADALNAFKHRGWFKTMIDEVKEIGGIHEALESPELAEHILNVRFRDRDVQLFPDETILDRSQWLDNRHRYKLYKFEWSDLFPNLSQPSARHRRGTSKPPTLSSHLRQGSSGSVVTPEHDRMQKQLMEELGVCRT